MKTAKDFVDAFVAMAIVTGMFQYGLWVAITTNPDGRLSPFPAPTGRT